MSSSSLLRFVLPVGSHRLPSVVQDRACSGPVESHERPATVERRVHRRVRLLGRAVVPADAQDRRERAVAHRCEEVAGRVTLEDGPRSVELRQRCRNARTSAG